MGMFWNSPLLVLSYISLLDLCILESNINTQCAHSYQCLYDLATIHGMCLSSEFTLIHSALYH